MNCRAFERILFLLAAFLPVVTIGQRLGSIMEYSQASEFPTGPGAIEFDADDSVLYMGFWPCMLNNEFSPGLARWDGIMWEAVENTMDSLQCETHWVRSIAYQAGDLFVSGNIDSIGGLGPAAANLARFDADGWHTCGSPNSWVRIVVVNDVVWAIGWYGSIGGQDIGPIAQYVEGNWMPFGSPLINNEVRALEYHGGTFFTAGNFTQAPVDPDQDILMWDGTTWQPVGNGIGSQNSWINAIRSFQGRLFVGGALFLHDGNPGQHLLVWDGLNWSGFFTDRLLCRNQVNDLQVINGKLYMAGVFQFADDPYYYNLLQYDGINLCAVGKDLQAHAGKFAMQVRGNSNEVYFSTTNLVFAGDTVNYLAKWVLSNGADTCLYAPLGLHEDIISDAHLFLHGNPQREKVEFSIVAKTPVAAGSYVRITSLDGRVVRELTLEPDIENTYSIDLQNCAKGIYLLCVQQPGFARISTRICLE